MCLQYRLTCHSKWIIIIWFYSENRPQTKGKHRCLMSLLQPLFHRILQDSPSGSTNTNTVQRRCANLATVMAWAIIGMHKWWWQKTYQSMMRCACGYEEAASSLNSPISSSHDWMRCCSGIWASAYLVIIAQCWGVRSLIGLQSKYAFVPQDLSRKPWWRGLVSVPLALTFVTRSWSGEYWSS